MQNKTKENITALFLKIRETALAVLFPRVCPVCGEILTDKNRYFKNPYICGRCFGKLDFAVSPRCLLCSAPLEDEDNALCPDCLSEKRLFDAGYGMMVHDKNARKIIYPLKYKNMKDNADFLAFEAAGRLKNLISSWKIDAIVPVPLHKKRLRERGYNQAEEIARRMQAFMEAAQSDDASKEPGLEADTCRIPSVSPDLLRRARKTRPLKELGSEERRRHVKNAFKAAPEGIYGKHILVIDDIFTSGATINECAKVLKAAGASAVYFITMSIVP